MTVRRVSPDKLAVAASQNIKEEEFWLNQLAGDPVKSHFPFDYKKTDPDERRMEEVEIKFPETVVSGLMKLSKGADHTLNVILAAGLVVLLHKYTGGSDITIGTPIYKQDFDGEFVNTLLVLRNRFEKEATFKQILVQMGQTVVEATKHYRYPIELLPGKLNLPLSRGECPFFDTAILLRNIHDRSYIDHISPAVIFSFNRKGTDIEGVVEFDSLLYARRTPEQIINHFINLLKAVLVDVDLLLPAVDILSEQEKKQLLVDFNKTGGPYPADKTISQLFEEQAGRGPDGAAVTAHSVEHVVTYKELNENSDGLAYYLYNEGVRENDLVGIMAERSLEMIIGILGILKAGAAYVPLNPKSPGDRTKYMLDECNVNILLTTGDLFEEAGKPGSWDGRKIFLEERKWYRWGKQLEDIPSAPPHNGSPRRGAYVIFTSGSTGKPKGVPITHANLSPLLHWGYKQLAISPQDRAIHNLAYYFDWSVWEIFITLTSGAGLYMVPDDLLLNPAECIAFIAKHRVTVLHATPTQYLYYVNDGRRLETLKYLFIGAEKLTYELVKRSFDSVNKECRVFNMYGPTEATIISAVLEIDRPGYEEFRDLSSVPIGTPSGNTTLLVLDANLNLCPVNIVGELYIAGDGLAPGYLNSPELTAEKFCLRRPRGAGSLLKLYKTGDRARWLVDGNVEFLGRIDHQVKLRGFRIELGEIESKLLGHPQVKDAVVLLKEGDSADKYLCAYIIPADEDAFGKAALFKARLKEHLSGSLPDYMIPSYFIPIKSIPLNPNGKIDTKALPLPRLEDAEEDYIAPADKVEEKLVETWSSVLGIEKEKISVNADFFRLGGHSLKVTVLISRIHKTFNIKIPFMEVFTSPTISGLAGYIKGAEEDEYASIEAVEKKEYYRLSPAQKRVHLLQQMDLSSTVYNMPQTIPVEEEIDRQRLQETFEQLIHRHESLRTSFLTVDREPVQRVHDKVEFQIEYYSERTVQSAERCASFVRPFDLSQAPLLRVRLIEKGEAKYLVMVDMHHITADGISREVLGKDFEMLSMGIGHQLPVLRLQYKDYAQWQNSEKERETVRRQQAYWLQEFGGEIPVLNLPTDFPRPVVQSFEGNTLHFDMGPEQTGALRQIARKEGGTLYILLLAMTGILLNKLTGQEDIIIGTPIAGRRHADLQQIIGMFVNTLAMRIYPKGGKNLEEFLANVKESTLQAYENQDYPFEELVEKIAVNRDTGRNPLFDVMFALQNMNENITGMPELDQLEETNQAIEEYEDENKIAKFDLTLIAVEAGEKLVFAVQYCTSLFKEETIQRFIAYFKNLTSIIITGKGLPLSGLEIIPEEERKQLLVDFNNREEEYTINKTIPQLFQEQAARSPGNVALVAVDRAVTYKELNENSGLLACYLYNQGVRENDLVGIMVERSLEMIVGILGILKAGAAYVPLNPKAPGDRTNYILQECNINILLTTGNLFEEDGKPASWEGREIFLGERERYRWGKQLEDIPSVPPHNGSPNRGAYVIFTSGSTGKPKGVPIDHANLSPLLHWGYKHLGLSVSHRAIQNLSYYFDWSVWEIFITLTTGAGLYMVKEDVLMNPRVCISFMEKHGITVLHVTPTQYGYFVDTGRKLETLKHLFIGAEKLTYDLVQRSFESVNDDCRVFNMYGPTEATIIAAVLEIERQDYKKFGNLSSVPIGGPVGNTELLILDNYLKPCPVNVFGELYITGDGLAPGYLNSPELTAVKFCLRRPGGLILKKPPPWTPRKNFKQKFCGGPGGGFSKEPPGRRRLYKTGDRARWLVDGNVEFLGRIDYQVKIRGFRIEPGEIENRLLSHEKVKEAVVIDRAAGAGEKYLCAYVVSGVEGIELKEYLSGLLPDYMIPAYFVNIDKIPLNPNGKVDRNALPLPGESGAALQYTPPEDELQEKLVEIWTEVLGGSDRVIGIDDDFFRLGGHSLKASLLVTEINEKLSVTVPLVEVFRTPTVRLLAEYIGETRQDRLSREVKDENLVLLKKKSGEAGHLFLIHDGTGEVEGYVEFCNRLNTDFNCWGIRADKIPADVPRDITIEELAEKYIKKIKKIQPDGAYFIAGWSIGGTIAFEMVRQLERAGQGAGFLALIDATAPGPRETVNTDTAAGDLAWREIAADPEDPKAVKRLIPPGMLQIIPNYHRLGLKESTAYLRTIRTLNHARSIYLPEGKINTVIHLFHAGRSTMIDKDRWLDYSEQAVEFYEISGDHFSIFRLPGVIPFAEIFDKAMANAVVLPG